MDSRMILEDRCHHFIPKEDIRFQVRLCQDCFYEWALKNGIANAGNRDYEDLAHDKSL